MFLELKIDALNKGQKNAIEALQFLTTLINQAQTDHTYFIFSDKVSYRPEPRNQVAKLFEDCYQLFSLQNIGDNRLIRILIFFKGKVHDNFLIRLDDERQLCEIEDIEMGEISNRGIASICLRNLETVLKQTKSASRVIAGLSPHHYTRRKHLYHFYSKNGYQIMHEVSDTTWGLVEKFL